MQGEVRSAEPNWVSATKAARTCGRCRKTIMRWIERGQIDVEIREGPDQPRYHVRIDQVRAFSQVRRARYSPGRSPAA